MDKVEYRTLLLFPLPPQAISWPIASSLLTIAGPLPASAKMMATLPNHEKRSAPAPAFSRHSLAKPKMITSTASHQDRFSSQGRRGPSISFCSIGMRAPARPIRLSKNCGNELPAGPAGAGDGVGLGV